MDPESTRMAVKVFYDQHITPALLTHGYERDRRTYRRASTTGDLAIVDFQVSSGTTRSAYQFFINLGIAPVPWIDYLRTAIPTPAGKPVHHAEAMLRTRVRSSDPVTLQRLLLRFGDDIWTLTPSVEAAHETAQTVLASLLPRLGELAELLQRDVLIDRLRTGEGLSTWFGSLRGALIVLLADRAPSSELDELLEDTRSMPPAFLNWVYARIEAHAEG